MKLFNFNSKYILAFAIAIVLGTATAYADNNGNGNNGNGNGNNDNDNDNNDNGNQSSHNFMPVTQCFRDTGATGWVTTTSNTGFSSLLTAATGADNAGSGWLRLTDTGGSETSSAYYNLPINVTALGIQAQFNYKAWGGNGADGIGFFLFDGLTTASGFKQGDTGGALGYCKGSANQGLSNAVLGLGIDDWGNFENKTDRCKNHGTNGNANGWGGGHRNGSIGLRGPGNGSAGYKWLAHSLSVPGSGNPGDKGTWFKGTSAGVNNTAGLKVNGSYRPTDSQFYRKVTLNISPTVPGGSTYNVDAKWTTSPNGVPASIFSAPFPAGTLPLPVGSTSQGMQQFPAPSATVSPIAALDDIWNPLPPTVKFGFFGATGGSNNYHEIQDAFITEGMPDLAITQNSASAAGGKGTFLVTVTNIGSIPATDATFNLTSAGLGADELWSCTPSGGSSCPTNGIGDPSNINISLGMAGSVTFTVRASVTNGSTITDNVTVTQPATGFVDADTSSNTSTTSLTISNGANNLLLAQMPQTTDSSSTNTVTGGQVQTSTQVYINQYHPSNWWGEALAYQLTTSGCSNGATLCAASTANWNASCNLTGGACPSVTGSPTYTAITPGNRTMFTWNNTSLNGVQFAWGNLDNNERTALGTDPILGSLTGNDVVNYLMGVRTKEQKNNGPFRTRTGLLGDVVDSNPVWVGPPESSSYPTSSPWSDLIAGGSMAENATLNSYAGFKDKTGTYGSPGFGTRKNVVYVESNDGMLHGFSAGHYNSAGNYISTDNTGDEVLSYIPSVALSTIAQDTSGGGLVGKNYNFTDPSYTHRFFNNATPGTGDLYYNSAWHTWLAAGMGAGGQAIYVLDITDPTKFTPGNSSKVVVKEFNLSTLTCENVANCNNDLGWTYGTPIISRMHNGKWAVVFGNGYNSANGYASIFIATIDNTSGTNLPTFKVYELQTNSQAPNGINYVTPADLDGDNVVDYFYAGDLFGNVWRFDVLDSNPDNWLTSKFGNGSATPLYSAVNANGAIQPITTQVKVVFATKNGLSREIITFGTGSAIEESDLLPDNTANGVQSIYGIWDWDMSAWNSHSIKQYEAISEAQSFTRSGLQQQSVTGAYDGNGSAFVPGVSSAGYRTLTSNGVCWANLAACSYGKQYGYYLDLPSLAEQVVYNPTVINGIFVVNTTIPSNQTQGLTCYPPNPPGGWTMALNPLTGGAFSQSIFGANGNFTLINGQPVSGMFVNAVGTPSNITYDNKSYLLNKTSGGSIDIQQFNTNVTNLLGHRLIWNQLR